MEDSNSQRLVLTQIIQEMKNQEDEQQNVASEELEVMKTDLDRKEYLLQQSELKVYHYEKYLQRKGLLESEARQLLNKYQLADDGIEEGSVSNVVRDNIALRDELKHSFKEVNRLEKQNIKKKQAIFELKEKVEALKTKLTQQKNMQEASPKLGLAVESAEMKFGDQMDDASPNEVDEPAVEKIDWEKLKSMKTRSAQDYMAKLEVLLSDYEQELKV